LPIRSFAARPLAASRFSASALLATTSVAALLLGAPLPAWAGGISVTNNPNGTSVSNPVNATVTSIIVDTSTLTGTISNAGTITPGVQSNFVGRNETAAISVTNSTIGQGIVNSGTITTNANNPNNGAGDGVFVGRSTISSGGIANTNAITVTSIANTGVTGIAITGSTVAGGTQAAITNSGTITARAVASFAAAIVIGNSTITGDIVNSSTISATGLEAVGVEVFSTTVTGSITNGGSISTTAQQNSHTGISIRGGTVTGSVTNSGTLNVSGSLSINTGIVIGGVSVAGAIANLGTINVQGGMKAVGIHVSSAFGAPSSIGGGIANSGTIAATAANGSAVGITVGLTQNGTPVADQVANGITNSGTILVNGNSAVGIQSSTAAIITGGITNSGTIIANGALAGTGLIVGSSGVTITNTGTVFGSLDAISLEAPNGITIMQEAGALIGSVTVAPILREIGKPKTQGAGIAVVQNGLNITGGALSLQPTSTVGGQGFGGLSVNQTGGNVLLQVTPNNTAGNFPTVNVNNLTLSGVLEVGPQSGSFASGQTITYSNVFNTSGTLTNNVTSVQVFDFFSNQVTATLTPTQTPIQGETSLDVTLTNNSGMTLMPGVASGAGTFTGLTNPLGGVLPAVSVTKGASVNGGVVNAGFIGTPGAPGKTGILVSGGQLSQRATDNAFKGHLDLSF
jgi:hypothetical protein